MRSTLRALICSATLLLTIAASVQAQVTAIINAPKEAALGDLVILDGSRSNGQQFRWILLNSKKAFLAVDNSQRAVFSSGTSGEFIFALVVAGIDNNQKLDVAIAEHRVMIGTPPEPTPTPTPTPTPAPVVAPELRVLILFDQDKVTQLPIEQQRILESQQLKDWLSTKCVKGTDGKTPEWRIWPSNIVVADDLPIWKKALAEPRNSPNWLLVSNSKAGYSGPLPATEAELMEILKRFGGQ